MTERGGSEGDRGRGISLPQRSTAIAEGVRLVSYSDSGRNGGIVDKTSHKPNYIRRQSTVCSKLQYFYFVLVEEKN